jgi:hypothetical protein
MVTEQPARTSLRAVQELLTRAWPGRDAPTTAWVDYHQRAVVLYQRVARLDPAHHHEALYWAGYERDQVEALRQAPQPTRDQVKGGTNGER